MLPDSYEGFFAATAGASGALVGLLFVAISVSQQDVLGAGATVANKVRASTALTALITPLSMSLFALIPGIGLRIPAIIAGVGGILYAASALRRLVTAPGSLGAHVRSASILIGYLGVMVIQITFGVLLEVSPHFHNGVAILAASMVVLLGIGVDRAWELVGGRRSSITGSISDLVRGDPDEAGGDPSPARRGGE